MFKLMNSVQTIVEDTLVTSVQTSVNIVEMTVDVGLGAAEMTADVDWEGGEKFGTRKKKDRVNDLKDKAKERKEQRETAMLKERSRSDSTIGLQQQATKTAREVELERRAQEGWDTLREKYGHQPHPAAIQASTE